MIAIMRRISKRLRRRRIPVLLQMTDVECGAACLAMILSYYGRKTRVSEARERFGVGRDGVTALSIVRVARTYGLRVKAYTLEPDAFKDVPLPAVVHWDFRHFVIVERWSPDQVDIVDPALGRRRLTGEEFDLGFTGVVLTFEKGVQFEPRRAAQGSSLRDYVLGYLFQSPGLLVQILLASILLLLLGLVPPIATKILIDQILAFELRNLLAIFGIGVGIMVIAQTVMTYLRSALLIRLQARLDSRLMLGFFEHLLTLPYRFFEQRTSGDLLLRLSSNAVIRETLTNQTISIMLDGALVLGYLSVLMARDRVFGLVVLAVGLMQLGIIFTTKNRVHDLTRRDLVAQSQSQSYLVEALAGISTVKATGAEDRVLDHWSNLFFTQLNVSLRRSHLSAVVETTMSALRTFAPLLLLWVGAVRVLDGTMTLGTMLALNALAAAFLAPLSSLATSGQRLQLVRAHLDRLTDVLEADSEQDRAAARPAPPLTGRIELRNVSFRYDPNSPDVLKDVSLTIEPGQKFALVGRSGSGKSTLVKLLLGLYLPTGGEIFYDGVPASELDLRSLRSQFGIVLQEPFLFSGTIRENIAMNDPTIPLQTIAQVAAIAGIHDDIARLPMGYETLIHEGGTGLSGGQRQRLAIARALAHDPSLLLLDEATSALDVTTEALVERNLSQLRCTRIVIAHRLSTVRNADAILVLEQGQITEKGTHDELLAHGGYYAALIQSQLDGKPAMAEQPDGRVPALVSAEREMAASGKPAQPPAAVPAPAPSAPPVSLPVAVPAPMSASVPPPVEPVAAQPRSSTDRAASAPRSASRSREGAKIIGRLQPLDVAVGMDVIPLTRTRPFKIGRNEDSELQLFDPRVSRNHACIEYRHGSFVLTDQGSTNGVFVNGKRLAVPTILRDGDLVEITSFGIASFRFETRIIDEVSIGTGERPEVVNA